MRDAFEAHPASAPARRGLAFFLPSRRPAPRSMPQKLARLSLFWRTFFLLGALLAAGIAAWVVTLRALDTGPRVERAAREAVSLVNLSRAGLRQAESTRRAAYLRTLAEQESVRIVPRQRRDVWEVLDGGAFERAVAGAVQARLGPGTIVAESLNGTPGLWIGFAIDGDPYWLQADTARLSRVDAARLLPWLALLLIATLLGAAAVAHLMNRPVRELSFAASRLRDGEYDSRLDENTLTSEIREVNMGFNRMARELAKVEEDRTVMLAGISHDLRTPLARLRLEAEMSVADEEARRNMELDIAQLDAIIDKFMDYARPGDVNLVPVHLSSLVDREAAAFRDASQIRITSRVAIDSKVMADETELGRVLQNLFENARRYGRSEDTGIAQVEVTYTRTGPWVVVSVRDHGSGVDPKKLSQLTTPFFRGDAARTAANGAGLGLAIVEKAMQRMGGTFDVANAAGGGLIAHMRLKRAP